MYGGVEFVLSVCDCSDKLTSVYIRCSPTELIHCLEVVLPYCLAVFHADYFAVAWLLSLQLMLLFHTVERCSVFL